MSTGQPIQYRFPAVRPKLQNLFPFDPKYDIEIIFKNNKYELQTAYLRLESKFFNKINPHICKVIKIQEHFNEDHFQQIMKCFYGGTFKCIRGEIFHAWKIFQFLKIQTFKKQTIKQMKQNFEKYNFFELMTFGFNNSVEQIFSCCLAILDANNFSHLRKNKEQVLNCPLQLFRFLINTHNRRPKERRTLNYIEVNTLLSQYSEKNQYSDEFFKELKFQLIEKTQLTAQQYRLIFIQGVKSQSTRQIYDSGFTKKSTFSDNFKLLTQSAQIQTSKPVPNDQKEHWLEQLHNLKSTFQKDKNESNLMKASIDNLSKSISRTSQKLRNKKNTLSKMQMTVQQIEKQIDQKRQNLKKIAQRIQKLQNSGFKGKGSKQQQPQEQNDIFVESHIIPGNCFGQIMNERQNNNKQTNTKTNPVSKFEPTASTANFSKKKKNYYESTNGEKSLIFDREPISVPRKYLDDLMKIMDTNLFVKKKQLNLIFRRSKSDRNSVGDPSAIKNRTALLLLFETSQKKYAGGFISIQIPSFYAKIDSICDYQAFIFSLTHNVKMPIMKGEQKSAISLSKHYLLSFGNDLMISNDCLNEVSYCQWPGIYEVPKNSKCLSAKDLVGTTNGEFKIEQIQIYEVKNEEIDMIL